MPDDVLLADLLDWVDAQRREILLLGSLSQVVRPGTHWVLRLHFAPAFDRPFTAVFHALDGAEAGLEIDFARLKVRPSVFEWEQVQSAARQWPRPEPCSDAQVQRETVLLQGTVAALLRARIEALEVAEMGDVCGGGTDGYGVRVDFRARSAEASFELINLREESPQHARAVQLLLWLFRVASRHLDEACSRDALRNAISTHILPDRTWP